MKLKTIDDVIVHLERASSMLQVYEEFLDEELSCLDKNGSGIIKYFISRYDLLRHQLDVIQFCVQDATEALRGLVK